MSRRERRAGRRRARRSQEPAGQQVANPLRAQAPPSVRATSRSRLEPLVDLLRWLFILTLGTSLGLLFTIVALELMSDKLREAVPENGALRTALFTGLAALGVLAAYGLWEGGRRLLARRRSAP